MATRGVSKILFVAAIDVGTTYSGYAFGSKADLDNERKDGKPTIKNYVWNAGSRSLLSSKAPTALLLNPDKTFKSFGYRAEDDYSQLAEEGEHEEYYYFHRFMMIRHTYPVLRKDTRIHDETGKSLPAIDVFSHSIRFLKNCLFDQINNDVCGELRQEDIQYVLTVPTIWDDKAKQFMREAAKIGGINGKQLMIALEAEAASILCQHIPMGTGGGEATYMVVDLGGGTADITVHQRNRLGGDSELKELHQATGGAYGGKSVDDAFETFLGEIVGSDKIAKLRKESMDDFIDIFRDFEAKKRSFDPSKSKKKESVSLPVALIDLVKSDKNIKTMDNAIKQSKHNKNQLLAWSRQKLQIPSEKFSTLFQPTIDGIIKHMEKIFCDSKFQHVDTIVMVGGFSECRLVQDSIQYRFFSKKIIVPDEPGLAVLRGAVLFGHKPSANRCRVMVAGHTYGVQSWPVFHEYYLPEKLVIIDGVAHCKDVFLAYVEKGQQIIPGESKTQVFRALKSEESYLQCAVYISDKRNPKYVDEPGCRLLGTLIVPLDRSGPGPAEIEETLIFGETELFVKARDIRTGIQYQTQFDLL